jgi:hypothetical protein
LRIDGDGVEASQHLYPPLSAPPFPAAPCPNLHRESWPASTCRTARLLSRSRRRRPPRLLRRCRRGSRGCSPPYAPIARTPHAPPTGDLTRDIPPSRSGHRIHAKRKHACMCSPVFLLEPSGYMEIISSGKGANE